MFRFILSVLLLSTCLTLPAQAQDVAGATDHPMLTRYPKSVIKWYDVQTFMPYEIAVGKVGGYRKIDDWMKTKGKVTRIYYELPGERTHADVYANYKKALIDTGFKLLADGFHPHTSVSPEIGTRNWLNIYYAANTVPASAGIELLHGTATSGGSAFLAAKKEQAGGLTYVAIGLTQQRADRVTFLIDVIEVGEVETGLVTIDAEAMGKDIDQYGKVALYGLYFDHDKASLKPESKPALVGNRQAAEGTAEAQCLCRRPHRFERHVRLQSQALGGPWPHDCQYAGERLWHCLDQAGAPWCGVLGARLYESIRPRARQEPAS